MHRSRFITERLRHLMFIAQEGEGGSQGNDPEPPSENGGGTGDQGKDQSKDFSRALAKRAAEIEAKYPNYDEYKEKAAKFDEQANESKTDIDKLNERLASIEKERDDLKAAQERQTLISSIAQETGLPASVVSMLSGDDTDALKQHAQSLKELMETKNTERRKGAPNAAHRKENLEPTGDETPMSLLRDAYSE